MPIQEILEQIVTYLRGIWRFRWVAVGIAWFISVGGWLYVMQMPDQFQASARVNVNTESILRPLLRGLTVQSNINQRVRLMTQTILSRPNLEKLARMTDLDIKAETPGQMDALIAQLKKGIRIQGSKRQNLYTLSATHGDGQKAYEIVRALLTIFVEDTMGQTRQDSNTAQEFLEKQIKIHEQRLVDAENRIKEFKQRNIGRMPTTGKGYFAQLQTITGQLAQAKLQLSEAKNRRDSLKRQLVGEEPVFGIVDSSRNTMLIAHPLDGRIAQMQAQLDELQLTYTEQHPSVVSRQQIIATLEEQRERELAEIPKSSLSSASGLNQNPVYQQLKISKGQAEADVASLGVRVEEYQRRVNKLKGLVNAVPEIEAEMVALNRDYGQIKKNYDTLVVRLGSAKLTEEAEQTGEDVKFKIIDPPRVPLAPTGPNRLLFSSAVLLVGIGAGLGIAFLLSQVRPVVYDQKTLKRISGYPVFGTVSRLWTPELLSKKRLEYGAFVSVGLVLVFAYTGIMFLHMRGIAGPGEIVNMLRSLI